jgi:MoaA/NifB/PqqE/SkfB family radical SAM enzyme
MVDPIQNIRDLSKLGINKIPKTLFWAIINYCNAVCTTCRFYNVPEASWKYVSIQDAKKAIDILYDSDFRMTSITGGEPLMNPDVFEICDYLYKKNIIITYIPTNGIFVTDYVARRLKDADVRLVGISIDLDDGKGMGLTRKISNLEQVVIHARECLEKVGIKTYAGILLTKSTLDIPRIVKLASNLGFSKLVFSYPQMVQSSSYNASRQMQDLVLNVDDLERAVEGIKLAKNSSSRISIHNPNISLDELLRFYRGISRKFKCYGGSKLFYLDWNLDLYRCFTLPTRYGNLLELGKVDFEEEYLCDLCTQQAFRDHDPFYYLASTIIESRKLFSEGHLISAARLLLKKNNRDALKALSEFLTGGFP